MSPGRRRSSSNITGKCRRSDSFAGPGKGSAHQFGGGHGRFVRHSAYSKLGRGLGPGRVDQHHWIDPPHRVRRPDQLLSTGQTFEQRILVATSEQPLKITLTYTDVPGLPAALPALVNDLDLEVIGPDGSVYRGNQMVDGESVESPSANDNINNVEGVHLIEPKPGDYVVRIRARNVVEDVHHQRERAAPQQDFAFVMSGDLPLPGVGILVFDRSRLQRAEHDQSQID